MVVPAYIRRFNRHNSSFWMGEDKVLPCILRLCIFHHTSSNLYMVHLYKNQLDPQSSPREPRQQLSLQMQTLNPKNEYKLYIYTIMDEYNLMNIFLNAQYNLEYSWRSKCYKQMYAYIFVISTKVYGCIWIWRWTYTCNMWTWHC